MLCVSRKVPYCHLLSYLYSVLQPGQQAAFCKMATAVVFMKSDFPAELQRYVANHRDGDKYLVNFHARPCRLREDVVFLHFTLHPVLGCEPRELSYARQLELHEGTLEMLKGCEKRLEEMEPTSPRPSTIIFVEHEESANFFEEW